MIIVRGRYVRRSRVVRCTAEMRLNLCESFPRRFCMKASSHVFAKVAVLSLLSVAFAISTLAGGNPDDKAISSRTADVDGVQLHYLTAGQGPTVVILLHGYAETSRMWRPIIPQLAERFTVIAPDLPGIGGSSIPKIGIDMTTSARRIHALVRSLGVAQVRVVGHDIGLMVGYAYATQ